MELLGVWGFYQVWFQLPVRRTSLGGGGGDGGGILFDAVRVGFVAFTPLVWRDVFLDSMFQFGLFVSAFSGLHLKVFWGLCVSAGQLWIPICLVCLFGGPWRQWVVHFLGFSIWRFWWTALQFINVRRYDSSPNSSGVRIRRPHHATMAPIPHCRVFLEYSLALFGASPPYFLLDSRVWREWERRHEVKWRWELFV